MPPVLAVKRPDPPALDVAALFDAHARTLLRVAARVAGAGPHCEDIVQETFAVAARRADELELHKPRSWLCAVCANHALHHARTSARAARVAELCRREAAVAEREPRPDEANESRARAWRVRAAVAELPELQRQAVVLNVFEEVPCAEIAAVLEVSVKTVESRVRLGREKIARQLEDLR